MKNLMTQIRISILATVFLAVILCGAYPFLVWVVGQGFMPARANGSLIERDGSLVGSSLLAQGFTDPKYFHPRPSAAGQGYDAMSSGGSNLGPTSKKLADQVAQRILDYRTQNDLPPDIPVPADAVTASASGLDPHISLKNAVLQASRVARTRGLREEDVRHLIQIHTEGRDLGILGEPGVNVLMLNLALDKR
jgi:potassium-transporting ATPase KdpC subunit